MGDPVSADEHATPARSGAETSSPGVGGWRERARPTWLPLETSRLKAFLRRGLVALAVVLVAVVGWLAWLGVPHGTAVAATRDEAISRGRNVVWSRMTAPLEARFPVPFAPLPDPLRFRVGPLPLLGSRRVQAFGAEEGARSEPLRQVGLLWQTAAVNPEEYVLVLEPDGAKRIVLARVDPEATLEATWAKVAALLVLEPDPLPQFDRLAIPKVRIDLPGVSLRLEETAAPRGDPRPDTTRYARLRGPDTEDLLPAYVFDEPFLLAVLDGPSPEPVLVAWIANADLLVAAE